jgi:hypothetical protein
MVGFAYDYPADHHTGWHHHPRARLLHAIAGIMRVATRSAHFVVPPGTGLWIPAHTHHVTHMPTGLAMRALFLREDAAPAGPDAVSVVALSPLLRALILAACEQPVMWDTKAVRSGMWWHWRYMKSAMLQRGRSQYLPAAIRGSNASRRRCSPTRRIRAGWRRLRI